MILKQNYIHLFLGLFLISSGLSSQQRFDQHEELGKVHWYRDYKQALAIAKQVDKDIVLLFQEVPGCATCRNYGHNVLSHPLVVEALENEFIPLTIFNNKGGKDREILKKYKEPDWNNPVVRIIDAEGKNIAKRISGDYSALTLVQRMIESINSRQQKVPDYLNLLEIELKGQQSESVEEKIYTMHCFWSGEKELGKLNGVLHNESGFIGNKEVVKVTFDTDVIGEKELDAHAAKHSITPIDKSQKYRVAAKDVHYYLQKSEYVFLPLTEIQQTKINSALGMGKSGENYLSPTQLKWLKEPKLKNPKVMFNMNFIDAWEACTNEY